MKFSDILSDLAFEAIQAGGNALVDRILPGSKTLSPVPAQTTASKVKTTAQRLTPEQQLFERFIEQHGNQTVAQCKEELRDLINELRSRAFDEGSEGMREMCIEAAKEHLG